MRKFFKAIINFFKNCFRYKRIENNIKIDLANQYRDYQQMGTNRDKLLDLVKLVDFCKRNGINGDTTKIQDAILKAWDDLLNLETNIKNEQNKETIL